MSQCKLARKWVTWFAGLLRIFRCVCVCVVTGTSCDAWAQCYVNTFVTKPGHVQNLGHHLKWTVHINMSKHPSASSHYSIFFDPSPYSPLKKCKAWVIQIMTKTAIIIIITSKNKIISHKRTVFIIIILLHNSVGSRLITQLKSEANLEWVLKGSFPFTDLQGLTRGEVTFCYTVNRGSF